MKTTTLTRYWSFGWNYQLLQSGFKGGFTIKQILNSIDEFECFISEYDLKVTQNISVNNINDLKKKLRKKYRGKLSEKADESDSSLIENIFSPITETLSAELRMSRAYILSEKRFNPDNLLYYFNKIFGNIQYNMLDPLVRYDFEESGKCIANSS